MAKNFNAERAEIYAKRAIKGRGRKEISLYSIWLFQSKDSDYWLPFTEYRLPFTEYQHPLPLQF